MSAKQRFRPSPALVVASIALFVALGGGAYAALKIPKNSVGTKQLKNNAVTSKKLAKGAVTSAKFASGAKAPAAGMADNALALGGVPASGYQGSCKPGAIKGSLVIDTSAISSTTYTPVTGFNCTGGAVQVRKTATVGEYEVQFVGSDSGSALASAGTTTTGGGIFPGDAIVVQAQKTPSTNDGEFDVTVHDEASAGGSSLTGSSQLISVLVF
jgi:hypothetical protein